MLRKKNRVEGMINVHRVRGEEYAVEFLRNADKDLVEGLFFQAKMFARAEFMIENQQHELVRNKDLSYTVNALEEEEKRDVKAF